MRKQTMNCPHCGEEVLASEKKCKHCGEWLAEPESASSAALENAEREESVFEKIVNKIDGWFVFCGLVFLVCLYSVPGEMAHIAKVNKNADNVSSLLIHEMKKLANKNKSDLYSVSDIFSEELCTEIRETIREEFVENFEYKRHLGFSVGKLDGETTQIGVLGLVIDFTLIDENKIKENAAEAWEEICEQDPILLGMRLLASLYETASQSNNEKSPSNDNGAIDRDVLTLLQNVYPNSLDDASYEDYSTDRFLEYRSQGGCDHDPVYATQDAYSYDILPNPRFSRYPSVENAYLVQWERSASREKVSCIVVLCQEKGKWKIDNVIENGHLVFDYSRPVEPWWE